jgi:flagellar FliL protein
MTTEELKTTEPAPRGSFLGRLLIVAFMGAVVISECLFAYFWLPSADEVAAQVELIALQAQTKAQAEQENQADQAVLTVEVDLGPFDVTNHKLDSGGTFRVDFHLWGTVAEEDLEEFNELFQRNKNRFRNQVIEEIRASKVDNLEEAGLDLIKRRFLEKSNTLLGKPLLRSVVFADYTFVEL